ncbi:hypothetical protein [Micromonospora sp. NPDC000442]|uniref:hypothetical protein n=1 Tax=Micromonospora sp. NPDC000442 TaxID=3364217 RepID=UPI003683E5CA
MRLERVTRDNYRAALALSVRPDQEDLVGPVVKSLAEAYVFPDNAWPRLIYDEDKLVGFLMAFLDIPWNSASPGLVVSQTFVRNSAPAVTREAGSFRMTAGQLAGGMNEPRPEEPPGLTDGGRRRRDRGGSRPRHGGDCGHT